MLLRINYSKNNIDTCTDVINSFPVEVRTKISINLVQIMQEKNHDISTYIREKEIYSIFRKAGFRQIKHSLFPKKKYSCYAELFNQSIINYDSRVFKCSTCDFENSEEEGVLLNDGRIVWNDSSRSKRLAKATFDNTNCLNCEYLPICRGGCSNNCFGANEEKCVIKPRYDYLIKELMTKFPAANRKLIGARQLEEIIEE